MRFCKLDRIGLVSIIFTVAAILALGPTTLFAQDQEIEFETDEILAYPMDELDEVAACPRKSCKNHCPADRDRFLGDWWGMAPCMLESGIVPDIQWIQFYQGVSSGGKKREFLYGGKIDFMFTFLGGKLGLNEGFTAIMHAETKYGDGIIGQAGALALPNVSMLYPLPRENDTAITGLLFMQALSENFQLAAGKLNVVDLWNMLYPHSGRGIDGFMNNNSLVVGLPWFRFLNLSFLGAGALVMKEKQIQGAVVCFDTNNCSTTSGFSNLFDKGAAVLGLWRFFTGCKHKPASHMFAGAWSSRTYTSLDRSSWVFIPGEGQGLMPGEEKGAWTLMYCYDQVLWADRCDPTRNLRLFTSWAICDGNPSFARWGGMVSIEGTGMWKCRNKDRWGIAYFHTGLSDQFRNLVSRVAQLESVRGGEIYYSFALTKYCHLTLDLQVIDGENEQDDTAIVPGLRLKLSM